MDTLPRYTPDGKTPLRRCKNCEGPEENKWHPAILEYFPPEKKGKYGLSSCCRVCSRKKQKRHRSKPDKHEHFLTYMKGYHRRPEVQEQQRSYNRRPDRRERMRVHAKNRYYSPEGQAYRDDYYQRPEVKARISAFYAQPEQKEQRRTYREDYDSRPEVQQHHKVYQQEYLSRPEVQIHRLAWHRAYWKLPRTRAMYQATRQRRRARLRAASGAYTPEQIQEQYTRQKGTCYYCGKKVAWDKYHVDHVVPLSRGGSNDISNLVVSCAPCNLSKRDKLPHEFFKGGRLL